MISHQGTIATAEHITGVKDETYNLISVLYHALQGSETCMQYLQDADQIGNQELAQFFQEAQDCQQHLATRAREILAHYLGQGNGHESHRGTMEAGSQGYGTTHSHSQGMPGSHRHGMKPEQEEGRGAGDLQTTRAMDQNMQQPGATEMSGARSRDKGQGREEKQEPDRERKAQGR